MKPSAFINKLTSLLLASLLLLQSAQAEQTQLSGDWQGELAISEQQKFVMVFHFKHDGSKLQVSFDVPAQNQFGIPFDKVAVDNDKIELALTMANIRYSGKRSGNNIVGEYQQGNFKAPLTLTYSQQSIARQAKPQEPTSFDDYDVETVKFTNTDANVVLAGELSLPKQDIVAAAILISGSGPTTRDEDVAGHKVFLVLSDLLAKQGIAVLRYDDRGVGESTGNHALATSADLASDTLAGFEFLRQHTKLQGVKVGLIGHSEGGLIGAIVAAQQSDIDFLVSLAGTGTTGAQILIDQSYLIQQKMGVEQTKLDQDDKLQRALMAAVVANESAQNISKLLVDAGVDQAKADAQAGQLLSPWMKYFIQSDPQPFFNKITMPVLALNGEKDVQVIAKQNIDGFKQGVKSDLLTTKTYPDLNHLFQPAQTGMPQEYAKIEVTFSEQVADDIGQWIAQLP